MMISNRGYLELSLDRRNDSATEQSVTIQIRFFIMHGHLVRMKPITRTGIGHVFDQYTCWAEILKGYRYLRLPLD